MADQSATSQPLHEALDTGGKPVLLMEDFEAYFEPQVAYVRQGEKVCFFLGGKDDLNESLNEGAQIVESSDLEWERVPVEGGMLVERVKGGKWVVEGPYQRSNITNANKRKYPLSIWEKHIGDPKSAVQASVKARGFVGHLEHPKDGRTDGNDVALVTTKLSLKKDGVVWGESEILDTPPGLKIQEYIRKNIQWGVSSRGTGSVNAEGVVNENDYVLRAFDAVMRPSTPGAYPKPQGVHSVHQTKEDKEGTELSEAAKASLAELRALAETPLDEMETAEQLKLASELLQRYGTLSGQVQPDDPPVKEVADLHVILGRALKRIREGVKGHEEREAARLLTEAADDADAEQQEVLDRLVKPLQRRIDALREESGGLRESLEAAQASVEAANAECAEAVAALETAQSELREALSDLEQSEQREADITRQLVAAQGYIAEQSADPDEEDEESPVEEAVSAALQEHTELEPYRSILERATSPDQVVEAVELLLTNQSVPEEASRPATASSRLLPRDIIVESGPDTKTKRGGGGSRGSKVAAAAVAKVTNVRAP